VARNRPRGSRGGAQGDVVAEGVETPIGVDEVVPPFRPADPQAAIRSVKPRSNKAPPPPGAGRLTRAMVPEMRRYWSVVTPMSAHIDNLTAQMSTELYVVT
jgi:hypothetical protein